MMPPTERIRRVRADRIIKVEQDDDSGAVLSVQRTGNRTSKGTPSLYIEERASQELDTDGGEDDCEYSQHLCSRYPENHQEKRSVPQSEPTNLATREGSKRKEPVVPSPLNTRPTKKKKLVEPKIGVALPLPQPLSFQFRTLFSSRSLHTLEKAVKQGVSLLDTLSISLTGFKTTRSYDINSLLSQISMTKSKATPSRTIIGVVGNTGAGKSSIINALLEEESVLPTSCMQACTAVVTEVSYNHQEGHRYRAEIEFISMEEWEKELRNLVCELVDAEASGQRRGKGAKTTDSEVAWAKLLAVYPWMAKPTVDLSENGLQSCLRDEAVKKLLRKKQVTIEANTPTEFYSATENYIGSQKEALGCDPHQDRKNYWPLIKVVRVFVKADVLKSGVVLVDLPGVQDSNAARAKIAEGYMMNCNSLWIVAPITRAVNDRTAKDLLGSGFKRQLFMDGGYQNTTFLCSKADDISVTEVIQNLDIQKEADVFLEELKTKKQLKKELKKEMTAQRKSIKQVEKKLEAARSRKKIHEKLFEKAGASLSGKVCAPTARRNARKTELSRDQIMENILEMKSSISGLKREIADLRHENSRRIQQSQNLEEDIRLTKKKREILCIEARNSYSKEALRRDFAAGLKEYDDETEEQKDPENFDPSKPLRNYTEVEKELPVFCVSARGYQKLCGRLQNDSKANPFTEKHQTEIPQLQMHCKNATINQRRSTALQFLTSLDQLLASLSLWCTSRARAMVEEKELQEICMFIEGKLSDLEKSLGNFAQTITQNISENARTRINRIFPEAASIAAAEAVERVSSLLYDKATSSSIHWQPLRAIYRKKGVHRSLRQTNYNLNSTLCEPIMDRITVPWGTVFNIEVPSSFEPLEITKELLSETIKAIISKFPKLGLSVQQKQAFENSVTTLHAALYDHSTKVLNMIELTQKQISRSFEYSIQTRMGPTYATLGSITGKGTLLGMRLGMERSLETMRHTIFVEAVDEVANQLNKLWVDVSEEMAKAGRKAVGSLRADLKAMGALPGGRDGEVPMSPVVSELKGRFVICIGKANQEILGLLEEADQPENGSDAAIQVESVVAVEDADDSDSSYGDSGDSDTDEDEDESDEDVADDLGRGYDSDTERLAGRDKYDANNVHKPALEDGNKDTSLCNYLSPVYEDDSEGF